MTRRRPPETAAGYYVLHDFRRIDWSAWHAYSKTEQESLLEGLSSFLEDEMAAEGDLGLYSIHGHKADFLILVLRPTLRELDTFERRFAQLEFATVTERPTSALGVTEASGYTEAARGFFDPDVETDPGIEQYMQTRLYPELPDADFLSFYFMDKRREPGANWYDLPHDERAAHVTQHGEIGKEFAGKVTQMITGTIGFDDWEWGVTLFSNDMVAVKELLTAMRFDPSTSRFAEFGQFYVGDRFTMSDLPAFMAGESLAATATDATAAVPLPSDVEMPDDAVVAVVHSNADVETIRDAVDQLRGNFEHYDSHIATVVTTEANDTIVISGWETERAADIAVGFLAELPETAETRVGSIDTGTSTAAGTADEIAETVRSTLAEADIYSGQPHGEDIHALVQFSTADADVLSDEVDQLAKGFDRYESHAGTKLYEAQTADRRAVVSLWETADAAETAAGYLAELPGLHAIGERGEFTTMGLFYHVKGEHRESFVDTFGTVGELLEEMEGHRDTELLMNIDDANDMFIASRWASKDDALEFFRSDAFADTVAFGRDVLAERPRHVFLV